MITNELKESILNEIDKPNTLSKHFPYTKNTITGSNADDLVIFYSKNLKFENRIYVVKINWNSNVEFPEDFKVTEVEDAVNYLFDLHHETTNTIISNTSLFVQMTTNHLGIVYLLERDVQKIMDEIKEEMNSLK